MFAIGLERVSRWLCPLFLGLGLLAGWLAIGWDPPDWSRTELVLPLGAGPSGATLFRPLALPTSDLPAVLLLPGAGFNRQALDLFAQGLAGQGMAVLSVDLAGAGESRRVTSDALSEAAAAVSWLRRFPGIDNRRIAVAGHASGGALAWRLLQQDRGLMAGVAIGEIPVSITALNCRGWVGIGLYNTQLSPLPLRTPLKLSPDCQTPLYISPFSSHSSEVQDPGLLTGAAHWLSVKLGGSHDHFAFWSGWLRQLWLELFTLCWWGLVIWFLFQAPHAWGELLWLTGVLGGLLLLPSVGLSEPLTTSSLVLGALGLLTWRIAFSREYGLQWRHLTRVCVCISGAYLGGLLVCRIPDLWQNPALLQGVPLWWLQEVRLFPQQVMHALRPWLFEYYTLSLQPSLGLAFALALEWFWPGGLARTSLRAVTSIVSFWQRPAGSKSGLFRVWGIGLISVCTLFAGLLGMTDTLRYVLSGLLAFSGLAIWPSERETCPRDDSNVRPTI